MSLLRKSTLKQFRNFRKEIKRQGGDIGDKISKDENKFPNMVYNRNPFDKNVKVDTYEDDYSIGNNTKLNSKEMKHVRTFESHDLYSTIIKMIDNGQLSETEAHQIIDNQKMADVFKADIKKEITKYCRKSKIESLDEDANYDFPYGIDQIPQFYLKQWLEKYSLWCEANHQKPEYSNFEEVVGDENAISTIFYHAELYAKDNNEMLDGSEFVDTSYLKESTDTAANYSFDILRMGKDITVGDIHGKIWKIEGADVYIETKNEDGNIIVKVPISKVAKAYKTKKD
jgi:hypothetical protein